MSIFVIAENLLKRSDNNIEVLFVILEELSKTVIQYIIIIYTENYTYTTHLEIGGVDPTRYDKLNWL